MLRRKAQRGSKARGIQCSFLNAISLYILAISSLIISCASTPIRQSASALIYYVDAETGNDQSDVLSSTRAWKTVKRVNETTLRPDDTVAYLDRHTCRHLFYGRTIQILKSALCLRQLARGLKSVI